MKNKYIYYWLFLRIGVKEKPHGYYICEFKVCWFKDQWNCVNFMNIYRQTLKNCIVYIMYNKLITNE